jgi:hypothetical protein
MLLGYAIRTWGPNWRFRDQDAHGYEQRELQSAQAAWSRFASGLGAIIATCGAVLAVLTFLLMLINPGDDIGVSVSLGATGLILAAVAVWAWMYFGRYGVWGVLSAPQPLSSYEPIRYASGAGSFPESGDVANLGDDAGETASELPEEDEGHDVADIVEDEAFADEFEARYSKYELHHPDEDQDETSADTDWEDDTGEPAEFGETGSEDHDVESEAVEEQAEVVDETSGDPDTDAAVPDEAPASEVDTVSEPDDSVTAVDKSTEEDHFPERDEVVDVVDVNTEADDEAELPVIPEAHQPDTDDEVHGEDVAEPAGETAEERSGREDALRRLRERRARRGTVQNDDA